MRRKESENFYNANYQVCSLRSNERERFQPYDKSLGESDKERTAKNDIGQDLNKGSGCVENPSARSESVLL